MSSHSLSLLTSISLKNYIYNCKDLQEKNIMHDVKDTDDGINQSVMVQRKSICQQAEMQPQLGFVRKQ